MERMYDSATGKFCIHTADATCWCSSGLRTLSCPSWKRALLVSRIENLGSGERNQKYRYYWKAKIITGKSQYIVSSVAMRSSIHSAAAQRRFGKVLFLIDEGLARDGSTGRRTRPCARSTIHSLDQGRWTLISKGRI
jgi:hypothetical protein